MSGSDPPLTVPTSGNRLWGIPHIRLSIFEHLLFDNDESVSDWFDLDDPCEMKERVKLKQYLTIDRASVREAAFLLYADIRLDQFPWDCRCEERMRVYAAGVQLLSTEGCLPLCGRWASLAEMLQFFPNLSRLQFPTIKASYYVRAAVEHGKDDLVFEEVLEAEDGNLRLPTSRCFPQDLNYQCWYRLDGYLISTRDSPLFETNAEGDVILAEVLRLPADDIMVWARSGELGDWTTALRHRTQQGIVTRGINWRIDSVAELEELVQAVPDHLQTLTILRSAEDFDDISNTANSIMDYIDNERFPALRQLHLRLDFPGGTLGSVTPPTPNPPPTWMEHDMPSNLKSIELALVCETYDWEDWNSNMGSHSNASHDSNSEIAVLFNGAAPKEWILNIRRKLGEDFCLSVETCYQDEEGIKDFRRSPLSYIDHLLYGSLSEVELDTPTDTDFFTDTENQDTNCDSDESQPEGGELSDASADPGSENSGSEGNRMDDE